MYLHTGPLTIIKAGSPQLAVFQFKAQWTNQVQLATGVGTKADNITGIRRNLGLVKYDMKHEREY